MPQQTERNHPLKKKKKSLLRLLFSRTGLVLLILLGNISLLLMLVLRFREYMTHYVSASAVLSIILLLALISSRANASVKVTWLVIFMILPVFGALLYLYTQSDFGHRALRDRLDQVIDKAHAPPADSAVTQALCAQSAGAAALSRYLQRCGFRAYANSAVTYFPSGEAKFAQMLQQLEQAQHFIFLEYFIVEKGDMWDSILDILQRKAAQGVEVRVMYDGTCEVGRLPRGYDKQLKKMGIQCKAFAPLMPFLSTHYNYRDHRKILVIDGQVAFTGGVNLADEYINRVDLFGHWKDTAVMLRGEAVRGFTRMFLQMWSIDTKTEDFSPYVDLSIAPPEDSAGFVIPYGDCPLDADMVGERVYMDLLNRTENYVHIMTPYLILDGEMETALKFAAERGAEVVLIVPGIPDKKIPYALAKTHYASLMDSGVKIYEYIPGFIHAKSFVSDGCEAVVGTINLDYRSLYHHFECAAYFYGSPAIDDMEQDFQQTLKKCRLVTSHSLKKEKWGRRLTGFVLKAIAPLL